jgi:hypothetical protein
MSSQHLWASLQTYESFGQFQIERAAAAGETTLETPLPIKPGTWRAWCLDSERLDALVEQQLAPDDAWQQLVLVHEDGQAPHDTQLPELTHVATVPVEGARFTVACDSLRPALSSDDGFYEHLDGVHGKLANGRGIHVMLGGDGRAEIWCDRAGKLLFVELK